MICCGSGSRAAGIVNKHLLASVALVAVAMQGRAVAADNAPALRTKAAAASSNDTWTGAYFGGHFGWGFSNLATTSDPGPGEIFALPSIPSAGMLAGAQIGYNRQFNNNVVLGLEADLTFADYFGVRTVTEQVSGQESALFSNLRYFGTARGRIGYASGRLLPYVTGGLAWGHNRVENDFPDGTGFTKSLAHFGWTLGAGVEYAFDAKWSAKAEYKYIDLGWKTYGSLFLDEPAQAVGRFDPSVHVFEIGLNYKLTDQTSPSSDTSSANDKKSSEASETKDKKKSEESERSDWSIHGQSTFIEQGYPAFRSPYEGTNSLFGGNQARETWTATAFIGRRLWEGAEIYFNPEVDQGFGLSDTRGVAGFPNGEAQKSNFLVPRPNVARLFLRQTFGLGGEQEKVEDGPNQIAGKRDVSRITVTAGKMAVTDIFDQNSYANDPRIQFLNWNMWGGGSFDYAGDQLGLTWGAVAELNQKNWAVRAGYFLIPIESNANRFDHVPRGQYVAELEERYTLFKQPGTLRLLGWLSVANMGNYTDAVAEPLTTPDYPDITLTRRQRENYGFVVNLEQKINDNLGLFSRASWNAGQNEIMSWTDCNASFSLGAVLNGKSWGRPDDKIGVAGLIEGLSPQARAYFAAGGLGILIGDGQLNYQEEKILEAYYALNVGKGATLTFDYQFVLDPAYNADRGPVSIFATRMHVEF
jgi:high affinity Mn2+ porin